MNSSHTPHETTLLIAHVSKLLGEDPAAAERFLTLLKSANLGKLMGGVAHTFNNILGGIMGYSQLLKEELEVGTNAYRQIEVIEHASKRASSLVSQLQIYSQNQSGARRVIDPKILVDEVVAIVGSSFGKGVNIAKKFDHGSARVTIDHPAIVHVFLNLCLNAKEAMPVGGQISISTQLVEESGGQQPGQYVIFEIADDGTGIDPDIRKHVFEPFFSTKETTLGCGLGLSVSQSIVRDHGGYITFDENRAKGTAVAVQLPTSSSAGLGNQASKVGETQKSNGGEVVMVVDDEVELCTMARQILERKGYQVLVAESGTHAIKTLKHHPGKIQLVILDMNMPGHDGIEVYRALKEFRAESKVILTSGYTYNSPYQTLIDETGEPFIPKPWDVSELLREAKRVLQA